MKKDEPNAIVIGDYKLCDGRAPGKVWIETERGEGGDFPIAEIEALIREYYDANF
jgi:hypothetical protein